MESIKDIEKQQLFVFSFCLIIFLVAAVLGWHKLRYGFNFIDEGYHATESWRLAKGDHFLDDKITGALMHYTLINSVVFKIKPDMTLLQWRQLQFILTIAVLLVFSLALFRQSRQYAWMPFVFSLFAFTGLDPVGMISNLYYQTYPHFFIVLFLSFMLFGFQTQHVVFKKFFFISSGLCLWLMSLSLLHLGLMILSPVIIFILARKLNFKNHSFSFKNLLYVMFPFFICWVLFLLAFNNAYFYNLLNSIELFSPAYISNGLTLNINWEAIKHVVIIIIFLSVFFLSIKKLPVSFIITACVFLSFSMLLIIHTSFFGFIAPYYNGWFGTPMWFSALLSAFSIIFWAYTGIFFFTKQTLTQEQELAVILMVPFSVCAIVMSSFSSIGALAIAQSAIPAVASISFFIFTQLKNLMHKQIVVTLLAMLLLGPFYSLTALSDWNFTYFDVKPRQANIKIETGFGKGIYTNPLYYKLYNWLTTNAKILAKPDDYAISYVVSPMVHMITGLLPSLDDTYINMAKSKNYYEKCIKKMKLQGREPSIAFIFEREMFLIPAASTRKSLAFPAKEIDFKASQDPVSKYIKSNMIQASTFKISDDHIIRCYVDNK